MRIDDMKVLILALVLWLPSAAHAQTCTGTISSATTSGTGRYVKLNPGCKAKKGDSVTVTPTPVPPSTPGVLNAQPSTINTVIAQAQVAAVSGSVTVLLAPGSYVGNFVLARVKTPNTITFVPADPMTLPATGARITPASEGRVPLFTPTALSAPTLTIQGDNYMFRGVQFDSPGVGYTTIELDAAAQPQHIVFDQVLIRGRLDRGGHRGIAANGIDVTVTNSWIDRIWEVGRDSQAIAAWDTPGPLHIENTYLEASGENFLIGGADPATCRCVVADVTFLRNTVQKDPAWRSMPTSPQVKNLLELKTGRRVLISGNTFRYNWLQAQTGWAILFTTQPDSGPMNAIEDVRFERNLIQDVASGTNIAAVSGPVRRLTISQNVWVNLDAETWGGDGRFGIVQAGTSAVDDLTITHNTVIGQTGNQFIGLYGDVPIQRFVMTHNIVEQREYGIHSVAGLAEAALTSAAPGAVFQDNAIIGPDLSLKWPEGNVRVDLPVAAQFDADYKLLPTSPLFTVPTSDGAKVGASR